MIGVTQYATYVPRYRLAREQIAKAWGSAQPPGAVAVANYDEDALTMAADAALAVLPADPSDCDALYFASTSSPYREKQVASLIATVCDLPRSVHTADFSGSLRAGVHALVTAWNGIRAGASRTAIVTAADTRVAGPESELEGLFGDGGAAVRLGSEHVLAEIMGHAAVSEEFTHVWRTDTERFVQAFPGKFSNTYGYNRDLGEAIAAVLSAQKLAAKDIAKLGLHAPDARAAADLAKELGFDPRRQLIPPPVATVGSAGTADALLVLAAALDGAAPGDLILIGSYGEGADVVLLRATDDLPRLRRAVPSGTDALTLASYEKYLKFRRIVEVDEPGEAINNVLEFKELKQDVRLYGSRCGECGTVQFPIARVCIKCQARDGLRDHKLQRTGTVFTFTVDHLIANLEHPLPMAVIDLDGGGRLYLQVTDFAEGEVAIGAPVTLTFRRLHEGGGNHNYFWKARPRR